MFKGVRDKEPSIHSLPDHILDALIFDSEAKLDNKKDSGGAENDMTLKNAVKAWKMVMLSCGIDN